VSLIALRNHNGWLILAALFAATGLLTVGIVGLRFRASDKEV